MTSLAAVAPVASAILNEIEASGASLASWEEATEVYTIVTGQFASYLGRFAEPDDLAFFMDAARGMWPPDMHGLIREDNIFLLLPAHVTSELTKAFQIAFLIFLPFLVIDMVVSSVLISMGMLMLPPIFISLPFKLLLFVLVDGWRLVAGSLLNSFAVPGVTT